MNDKFNPVTLQADMDQGWAVAVDWYKKHRDAGREDYLLDLTTRLTTPLPHAFLGMSREMLDDVQTLAAAALAEIALREINLRALLRWQEKGEVG